MLSCQEAERLASLSVDGELPRAQEGRLASHLAQCSTCKKQAQDWRERSRRLLLALAPEPANLTVLKRSILASAGDLAPGSTESAWPLWLAAAAALALAAGLGWALALRPGADPAGKVSVDPKPAPKRTVPDGNPFLPDRTPREAILILESGSQEVRFLPSDDGSSIPLRFLRTKKIVTDSILADTPSTPGAVRIELERLDTQFVSFPQRRWR